MRHRTAVPGLVTAFLVLVSACTPSGPAGGPTEEPATTELAITSPPTSSPIGTSTVTAVVESDSSAPLVADMTDASRFWLHLAVLGGLEFETFSSLEEMTGSADLVAMVRLGDKVSGPIVTMDEGDGPQEVSHVGIEAEILEVYNGDLKAGDTVVLRGFGIDDSLEEITREPAVVFLRFGKTALAQGIDVLPETRSWYEQTYRLVSLQGAYLATGTGMANPLAEIQYGGRDPISQEWVGRSVDAFISAVRSVAPLE